MRVWRAFFTRPVEAPRHAPTGVDRGRYLTESVAICGDCHTPRNLVGASRRSMFLAGAGGLPGGEKAPNLTPDKETGLGDWDEADIVSCLEMGMLPNMDSVQGMMEKVVDGVGDGPGFADADVADLQAIAHFIKSIPAIRHTLDSSE
jgi:mono/diheme cytochrome c family protein